MPKISTTSYHAHTGDEGIVQCFFVCDVCGKKYMSRSHLRDHVKKVHGIEVNLRKPTLQCPLCPNKLSTYEELDKELLAEHGFVVEHLKKTMNSQEDFEKWKAEFEKETQSSFVKQNSRWVGGRNITKYVCSRSGYYVPSLQNDTRQRAVKVKGSNKMGSHCPARLTCTKEETGFILLDYVTTHIGHELEVGRLRLTKDERDQIAGKLLQGIPGRRILEDIGKTFDSSNRLSLTNKQDIYNVKKAYNVQSDAIFHPEDAVSVDILIEKIKSAVLFYKPYGVEDSIVPKNDFFLVFMNSAQQDMLEKYGENILMIDSTHGTNPYNIQLTTLMVVDEDYQGFPVAFLWSMSQTEHTFQKFFSCLKQKIPELKPRTFLSDDANAFYNAFLKVYNSNSTKILCDWHVKKNLCENLTKINCVEKRKDVKKRIMSLMNELDITTFEKMLVLTTAELLDDPATKKYGEYFAIYYSKRPTQWAHCYRKGFEKNTNMSLEKWHQELKHNPSVGGRYQQRLDLSINNVLECLRAKFMRRMISISRNRVPRKLTELRRRHKLAEEFMPRMDIFEENMGSTWLISSSKNFVDNSLLEYYTVKKNVSTRKCGCSFVCDDCQICLHAFSCSCHDYSIQFNMCKHIHMISMKFSPKENTESLILPQKDLDERISICNHLESEANTNELQKERDLALQKLNRIATFIENCESLDSILYVSSKLTATLSGVTALDKAKENENHFKIPQLTVNVPANKKMEPQKRSLPPKKIKNKRRKLNSSLDDNESEKLSLNLILRQS